MHTYDAHWLPYFISSSGVVQFREVCYTVVSYAPHILLQIYTIINLATFRVTIFDIFHAGPQHSKRSTALKSVFCWIILIQRITAKITGTNVETFNNYRWRNVGFYLAIFFTGGDQNWSFRHGVQILDIWEKNKKLLAVF